MSRAQHWQWWLIEAISALVLVLVAVVFVVAMSGCAALQRERETRYMPEASNTPDTRAVFADAYEQAKAHAIADPSQPNIVRMVDRGSALSAISCGSWMRKDVLAAQGIVMRDSTLSAVDAASTIAAGAFKFSPGGVAALGGVQMIGHLFGQVEKTGLGAPDTFQAQAAMRGALADCSADLIARAKSEQLSLAQAVIGIDTCQWLCTPGAATTISTQALAQSKVVVQPNGGIVVQSVTSPVLKDDNGARIIGWWMQGGVVNQANDARLKAWMKAHGIETLIPFFAHSQLYAEARKQAVADLNIQEAK